MAGLFNFVGWIIILLGFAIGFLAIAVGSIGLGFMTGVTVIAGSLLTSAPFFAVAEVLNRLTVIKDLQYQSNETAAALLEEQKRTNQLLQHGRA